MTKEERLELFNFELNLIASEDIREFTKKVLCLLPEYFFKIPASTTGKYHPSYALGEKGLVRHTKAAVRIANMLFEILPYESIDIDLVYSALILHDGCKCGINGDENSYTVFEHPLEVCKLIKDNYTDLVDCFEVFNIDYIEQIKSLISSHMGKWNTDKRSLIMLPLPKTKLQNFVHMCDYLASRKQLEFNFEV